MACAVRLLMRMRRPWFRFLIVALFLILGASLTVAHSCPVEPSAQVLCLEEIECVATARVVPEGTPEKRAEIRPPEPLLNIPRTHRTEPERTPPRQGQVCPRLAQP